jgi:hypothetical protein
MGPEIVSKMRIKRECPETSPQCLYGFRRDTSKVEPFENIILILDNLNENKDVKRV